MSRPKHHLISAIPYPNTVLPRHINYLATARELYWLDEAGPSRPNLQVIRKANIGGEDSKVRAIVDVGGDQVKSKVDVEADTSVVGGLSIDWISKILYYARVDSSTSESSSIFATRLDGSSTVLIKKVAALVKDLVVVPELGILFWHEVNAENRTENVMRSWMDGTDITRLYSRQHGDEDDGVVRCLTYSLSTGVIYWMENQSLKQYHLASGNNVIRHLLALLNFENECFAGNVIPLRLNFV